MTSLDPQTVSSLLERIHGAASLADIDSIELEIFSRKHGVITLAMQELSSMDETARKERGKQVNSIKISLVMALENRKKELNLVSLSDLASKDRLDVTLDLPERERGHLHLIHEFIEDVQEVFGRMGFDTADGPEIESEELNFNLLNIPTDHPARDMQDTFWVKTGSKDPNKNFVLRTHTSPVQIRYMQNHKPPFRVICPGKVYRKDADATHSPMFHQFEGLMIGKDVSLANLKGVLTTAMRELIGRDVEFRFRAGFFPFVEPGLEMDMMWQGNLEESREGRWLEMGGCGMVHENVLKNCGIDPTKWQGFAFGFGVERPLMIKHQIPDLRSFYEGDMRFLRQF